jgi:hypothetical protein
VFGFASASAQTRISAAVFVHHIVAGFGQRGPAWPPDFSADLSSNGDRSRFPLLRFRSGGLDRAPQVTDLAAADDGTTVLTLPDADGDGDGFFPGTVPAARRTRTRPVRLFTGRAADAGRASLRPPGTTRRCRRESIGGVSDTAPSPAGNGSAIAAQRRSARVRSSLGEVARALEWLALAGGRRLHPRTHPAFAILGSWRCPTIAGRQSGNGIAGTDRQSLWSQVQSAFDFSRTGGAWTKYIDRVSELSVHRPAEGSLVTALTSPN